MSDSEDYGLEQARYDVCEDLRGRIAEVSLSFFKKSVLPPLISEELDNIVAATEHLVIDNRWKAFPKDPAHAEAKENAFFASLPDLFKDIVQTAAPVLGRKPTEASWQAAVARPSVSFDPENALPASYKVNGARFTLESNRIVQSHSLPTRNVINPSTGPSSNKAFDVAWLYEVEKNDDLQDILDVSYLFRPLFNFLLTTFRIGASSYSQQLTSCIIIFHDVLHLLSRSRTVKQGCGSSRGFSSCPLLNSTGSGCVLLLHFRMLY